MLLTCYSRLPIRHIVGPSDQDLQICAFDEAATLFNAECYRRKCDIWERNNTSVRVNTLPVELFTDILLKSMGNNTWMSDLRRLLGVSRLWKTTVQTSPRFWTRLDDASTADIRAEFLHKSKSAPLSIGLGVESDHDFHDAFLDDIVPHTARIRDLHLSPWRPTVTGHAFLRSAFPVLEDLNIAYGSHEHGFPSSLPSPLPELQRLSLSYFQLDWASALLPKLRHLSLSNIEKPHSVSVITDILSSLSLLESLTLSDWIPDIYMFGGWYDDEGEGGVPPAPEEWPAVEQRETIHLPNLEFLRLEAVPREISQAILTTVRARDYRHFRLDDTPSHCLSACSPSLRALLQGCESVNIRMRDWGKMAIEVYESGNTSSSTRFSLRIVTSPTQAMTDIEQLLLALSNASPTTPIGLQVGYVHSWDDYGRRTRPWHLDFTGSILENCPGLTCLWVGQNVDMDDALEYLARPKRDGSGSWSWPCPNLSELCIEQWCGDEDKFRHLAKVRWQVPGTTNGLPRRKLKSFQPPGSNYSDGNFQWHIESAMRDCYELETGWQRKEARSCYLVIHR